MVKSEATTCCSVESSSSHELTGTRQSVEMNEIIRRRLLGVCVIHRMRVRLRIRILMLICLLLFVIVRRRRMIIRVLWVFCLVVFSFL